MWNVGRVGELLLQFNVGDRIEYKVNRQDVRVPWLEPTRFKVYQGIVTYRNLKYMIVHNGKYNSTIDATDIYSRKVVIEKHGRKIST